MSIPRVALGDQSVPSPIRQRIETNWRNRKVQILCSFGVTVLGIISIATGILPALGAFLAVIGFASGMYNLLVKTDHQSWSAPAGRLEPQLIRIVNPEDVERIKASSDLFYIGDIVISDENKTMTVEVGHSAGNRPHDFELCVSSALREDDRNIPGRVFLHHNAHGEPAEACAIQRLVIDLNGLSDLVQYHIRNWANKNRQAGRFNAITHGVLRQRGG